MVIVKLVTRKILPLLLLIVLNVYQINVLLFIHVHYSKGIPVTHFHPFSGQHEHPDDGLHFIVHLSSFLSLNSDCGITLKKLFRSIIKVLQPIKTTPVFKEVHLRIPSLRAPPLF
ncbi:hypothetical protein D0T85_10775 [Bacteroides sp. 519]|nr:hypothetical protein [Bacteroides sp. 519]